MRQFDTSIKKIMMAKSQFDLENPQKSIFLSDWDVDIDTKPYSILFNDNILLNRNANINSYYYWTDEKKYSFYFKEFYQKNFDKEINVDSFVIGSNGTSSIMLSLLALSEFSMNRILVFTPVYFSILNLLEMLNMQIYRFDLDYKNNFQVNFDLLENYIKCNRIETIFITDPVFGTGIEHDITMYKELNKLVEQYNIAVIIDYIYGGMYWKETNFIFNDKSFYIINHMHNTIFIESISKRLFVNGIKFSLIFSSPDIIRKIKRLSIYTTGSMCISQLDTYKKIYDFKNTTLINNIIEKNTNLARNTYNKVLSFLIGKNCIISRCNSSFFFVLGIPKTKKKDDIEIAIEILYCTGILTIPHSRYLLEDESYYFFRVNLLLPEHLLFEGLSKIIP